MRGDKGGFLSIFYSFLILRFCWPSLSVRLEDCQRSHLKAFSVFFTLPLQANKRLTNVGISLHKQGQVLSHLTALPLKSPAEEGIFWDWRNKYQLIFLLYIESNGTNTKTEELLQKKRRLQNLLKNLKLLVQARKNFAAFEPTLKHQEKILNKDQ